MAGTKGKQPVMGMVGRGERVIAKPVINTSAKTLQHEVRKNIEAHSTIYSDEYPIRD